MVLTDTVLTDEELVIRCKMELPRTTRSYELLVQRHMDRIYTLVYRVVRDKEEAEDITQEVLVKVYNNIRSFDQKASFSTWLYRIAVNSALDSLEKIKRRSSTTTSFNSPSSTNPDEELEATVASTAAGPEEEAMQNDLRNCIQNVLRNLDREQARVLVMRDFEDLSYADIAQALEAKLSAVKMRIHRARLAFQTIFNQFCGQVYLSFSTSSSAQKGDGANTTSTRKE
ncbi:MAG: sigma-70 family RNA polymerase sigma factor [Ktedonobacteraceae bacterium]|nr:sigma-70 family RNA polymerase sigma factor [Ktedonobacteraceae bacterium]